MLIFPWNDCHESTNCDIMIHVVVQILLKLKDIVVVHVSDAWALSNQSTHKACGTW